MISRTVAMPAEADFSEMALVRPGFNVNSANDVMTDQLYWQKLVEREPHNEAGWFRLAALTDDHQQAIVYLRRVLEINPQNEQAMARLHQALLNEGIALAKSDNKSRARWLLMEASALNPHSEDAWLWLAAVAEKVPDAVRCLQKVLKLNPQHPVAIAKLNQLYALQSNFVAPAKVWQCPMCSTGFPKELPACPSCRAQLTYDHLDELLQNREVEKETLLNAIQHYENLLESIEDFHAYFYLSLAYAQLLTFRLGT